MAGGDEKLRGAILVVGAKGDPTSGAPSPQDAPPIDPPSAAESAKNSPRERRAGWRLGFWTRLLLFAGGTVVSVSIAFSLERLVVEATEIAPWAGWAMRGLVILLLFALIALIFREIAALGRVRRVSRVRKLAALTRKTGEIKDAEATLKALASLYAGRRDLGVAPAEALRRAEASFDAADRIKTFERIALSALDEEARQIIRRGARDVATVTALAPSVLIDAVAALYVNLRTIRQLAQLYGGRAGFFGALRLARRVIEHAMAAGLIALGDDILEPLMGGGLASKLSRRLGEGVVNGAMTARIGIAAMEVCRPLPFDALPKPKLREIAWSALSSVIAERR